ncbi:Pleckstrin homology domain-containing protein [Morchella snyderi]|nr:Pleckstrin homology domain-containing protein [Morchella snyderi]
MSDNAAKPEEKVILEPSKATEESPTPGVTETEEVAPGTVEAADEETPEEKKEEKPEPKEITHGLLAKAHGGLLSFFKQKRFFYFQDEPISEDKLKVYLHKDGSSRSTAAYASQTSKGLLLYTKTEGQKEVPHGIIKLADVTEVQPVGTTKFVLKLAAQDLHFESSAAERDSWVFTLNHKISEAKAASEDITNSEGYKAAFEKLTKPTVTAAAKAVPEKPSESTDVEAGEVKDSEAKADKEDVTSGAEEESGPADRKAEAPSKKNKRTSVFAFLDKKKKPEEGRGGVAESKEEEQKEEIKPTEQEPVAAPAVTEDAPTEIKETVEADEADKPAEPTAAPKPTKRNSIFGAFIREKKEEEKKEDAKAEASEPTEVVATEAKPLDVPVEAAATEKTPESASSPPKQKFLSSFFDKKERSPVAKTAEKETDTKPAEVTTEIPAENIDATPIVAVDESAAPDATSPATSPREQKRKSSFFSFKKDKKSEDVKSDSEDAEPALKSGSTSPLPKAGAGFLGLMRKASKSTKSTSKEVENKEVAAPETVAEEPTTAATTGEADETVVPAAAAEPTAPAIEDVVPETVTVGQSPVQATT